MVAERSLEPSQLEPLVTLTLALRRFSWAVIALQALPPLPAGLSQAFGAALSELESAVREGRPPSPLSPMGAQAPGALLQRQVERLTLHLGSLHDAAARLPVLHEG